MQIWRKPAGAMCWLGMSGSTRPWRDRTTNASGIPRVNDLLKWYRFLMAADEEWRPPTLGVSAQAAPAFLRTGAMSSILIRRTANSIHSLPRLERQQLWDRG